MYLPKPISGFPGRYILDNVMVVIEIIHHMKTMEKGKKHEVAPKYATTLILFLIFFLHMIVFFFS